MTDKPEDTEIVVEEPKKEEDTTEIVVAEEEKDQKPTLLAEDGIKELKFQLEQERLARAEAEKRAREAAEREAMAKNEVDETNLQLVNNAIDTVRRNNELLKASYREAMSIGDYDKAAEYQASMSENAAKLVQLENGRQAMESKPKAQPEAYRAPQDPVEMLASQLSPRSAAWVRRNPQFATDQRLFQKMIAAHNLAVADGLSPDSDEYFASVEDTLKVPARATMEVDNPMTEAAKPTQRRSAPPAAPVTRSGTGTGTRPNVVRLTAEEREMAQMMGMTEKEYALNKVALQKEGKLN